MTIEDAPKRIETSGELRAITERYWSALTRGDVEAVVSRFSRLNGVTLIGTDETEFIADANQIVRYAHLEFEELGGWPLGTPEVEAWVEGSVGWAIVRSSVDLPNISHGLRVSIVFHLERDEWKLVHQHWSVGQPNEEIFGVALTFNLEAIAGAVGEERPDLSASSAPDGTVTIVFTDIEGSTSLNASFGNRAWLEVLRAHNRVVEQLTAEHGGTVVKGQGDGFMLAFPSAKRAISCARAIERSVGQTFDDPGSPIRVRIGVHTGEVVHESDDFFGHAVNYAARVTAAASGGEILVSSLVHDLVATSGEFAFEEPPLAVELKGIDGVQQLYRLG